MLFLLFIVLFNTFWHFLLVNLIRIIGTWYIFLSIWFFIELFFLFSLLFRKLLFWLIFRYLSFFINQCLNCRFTKFGRGSIWQLQSIVRISFWFLLILYFWLLLFLIFNNHMLHNFNLIDTSGTFILGLCSLFMIVFRHRYFIFHRLRLFLRLWLLRFLRLVFWVLNLGLILTLFLLYVFYKYGVSFLVLFGNNFIFLFILLDIVFKHLFFLLNLC